MSYNPRSILDAHMDMEIDLESMHWSQPLIAMGKRENMMRKHFAGWEGKDARVISRASTRTCARTGWRTTTTIIGWTRKCFDLAQLWWAS
jgi:hypothetical protein